MADNNESAQLTNDSDSLDSDGYDKNDPYSAMAKKFDLRNKAIEEFENLPMIKVSNKILKNRANITYFEKKIMKYVVLVVLLAYVVIKNLGN